MLALPGAHHSLGFQQLDHRFDVPDPRQVVQRHGTVGEERGREDRQRGVLVPGGTDAALESVPAVDDETWHGRTLPGGEPASKPKAKRESRPEWPVQITGP